MKKPRFYGKFRESCLIVAEQCHGRKGVWAYDAFMFINEHYFASRLPWPHIIWGLTAHGKCVAWSNTARDKSRPPIIALHPSLLQPSEKLEPWGLKADWFGPSLVFDVLLHECIHTHIEYNLGGHDGRSSHDCSRWIRQVNRIAPLLGFEGIRFGGTELVRLPDPTAPLTARGNVATKVVRRATGTVPFAVAAGFPGSLRHHLGQAADYYRTQSLPDGAARF